MANMLSNILMKTDNNILLYGFIFSTIFIGIYGTSCTPVSSDPNMCGEIKDVVQCFIYPSYNKSRRSAQTHRFCYKIGTTCKPKCCKDWITDSTGKCKKQIFRKEDAKDNHDDKDETGVIIPLIIIAVVSGVVLFIIVGVIIYLRGRCTPSARQTKNRSQNNRTNQRSQAYDQTVFSIYNNEPPPYDVVVGKNLPEYSSNDKPSAYHEVV